MRWPRQRRISSERLALSWSGDVASYVLARPGEGGVVQVLKAGVVRQSTDGVAGVVRQLETAGLKGLELTLMLGIDQYQLLQIDTPNVPPEELRSAARYQVRDMLATHVDDVTIDVIQVGDGRQQGISHSFVVAANNTVIQSVTALAHALECNLSVIDIEETAQRNLQSALARSDGVLDRANAALVLVPGQQAVLTISANEELFYTRRFDVPEGFLTSPWGSAVAPPAAIDGFTPVQEYVPAHAEGDISLDSDFDVAPPPVQVVAASVSSAQDDDRAQRLVLEVQRSLDVWDRTWSNLPLNRLRVFAGERSDELAQWLTGQLGQTVGVLDVSPVFAGLQAVAPADLALCFPLLGVLLRSEVTAD